MLLQHVSPGFNHNINLEYYKDVSSNICIQAKCHFSSLLSKYWIIINLIKQCRLFTCQHGNLQLSCTINHWKMAKTATNYHIFSLDNTMSSKVIALSIRKQRNHKFYRRSRGRRTIFHNQSTGKSESPQQTVFRAIMDHCRNILPVQLDNTKVKSASVSLIHCALINCRSVIKKSADLQIELVHNKVDICFLMETWIKEDDRTTESEICPLGYKAISVLRSNKQGGGIAIVYKDSIMTWRSNTYDYSPMECMELAVSLPGLSLKLAVIYRPPDKSVLSFANDFLHHMGRNINSTGKLLLTGDLTFT